MPGFAAATSAKRQVLRPAMITWFPDCVKRLGQRPPDAGCAAGDKNRVAGHVHAIPRPSPHQKPLSGLRRRTRQGNDLLVKNRRPRINRRKPAAWAGGCGQIGAETGGKRVFRARRVFLRAAVFSGLRHRRALSCRVQHRKHAVKPPVAFGLAQQFHPFHADFLRLGVGRQKGHDLADIVVQRQGVGVAARLWHQVSGDGGRGNFDDLHRGCPQLMPQGLAVGMQGGFGR